MLAEINASRSAKASSWFSSSALIFYEFFCFLRSLSFLVLNYEMIILFESCTVYEHVQ
jgi:hypothetical protein